MTALATAPLEARNARSGLVVASRLRSTRSMWERLRGLLGHAPLEAGEALLIRPCNGIHTVGMRYPIDVVFVDRAGRIVRLAREVQPLRFIPWVRRAHAVIELPVGMIDASCCAEGDTVEFVAAGVDA